MLWQTSLDEKYLHLAEEELSHAITAQRKRLGDDLLILAHHYQQDDVIAHADLSGDSLKLSQLASEEAPRRGTKYIIFCGVHFMAESAEILTGDDVQVILPDLSAGCSMADMADEDDALMAWEQIHEAMEEDWPGRVIPITYVNSSAAIKAFVGENGGACCTSSNAQQIFRWAQAGGTQPRAEGEDIKILFLPDQHLGRNTASKLGYITEVDQAQGKGESETAIWNPKLDSGGLSPETIRKAKVLLWAGHCSVHKLFRPEHIDQLREQYQDNGGITVMVHPECDKTVVDKADLDGSTSEIIQSIRDAEPGTHWAIGTEVHLVNRIAKEAARRDVHVQILSDCQCLCTTMYRIDQRHLLWVLDNLAAGKVVNRITVPSEIQNLARLALDRMLMHVGQPVSTPVLAFD